MDGYQANTRDGTPLMGKTGTTSSSKQTWVTSSSTKVTTTVWVGNISGNYPMRSYPNGGNIRHLVSHDIMSSVNRSYGGGEFDVAPTNLIQGTSVIVGDYVGTTPDVAKSAIEGAKLIYSEEGTVDSSLPAGQIAQQSPSAGSPTAINGTVKVWLSNGSRTKVPDVTGKDFDSARGQLQGEGFDNVSEKCVPLDGSDPANLGTVVSSYPAAGKAVKRSDPITLSVLRENC
jgi:membrane peptidoglycan carboxypeptidase